MRQLLISVAVIAFVNLVAAGQAVSRTMQAADRPNFSGTWEAAVKGTTIKDKVWVIAHAGDEITISESFSFEKKPYTNIIKLFTDKRGERNRVRFAGGDDTIEVNSRTSWDKNKLVRKSDFESAMEFTGRRYRMAHVETQVFSLSEDGNTLSVSSTSRRDSPFSSVPIMGSGKMVYRRRQ